MKTGSGGQGVSRYSFKTDRYFSVPRSHGKIDPVVSLPHVEIGSIVLAGKKCSANRCVHGGVSVAPRDEHAFSRTFLAFPYNRNSMCGVFAAQSESGRHHLRANVFKSD